MSDMPPVPKPPRGPSAPHPGVQARVERLVATFRAAQPGLPPGAELKAELDAILAGTPRPPQMEVLRETWMTALAASAHAAELARQLEQSHAVAGPSIDWLVTQLATARGVEPDEVVTELRDYMRTLDKLSKSVEDSLAAFQRVLDSAPAPALATLADLQAAIDAGEPCARLIEIKQAMGPKSEDREAANEALRAVGCYLSTSKRTDL